MRWTRLTTVVACVAALTHWAHANDEDLTRLSLEELMNEPVTSVSKKKTRLSESPAAIAVVTQEDIRRSGITTLAEALRLVPGTDVARISSSEWAVSARGFNNEYAGKLLVLIDGRTVYTPSTAGVSWNVQDVMLEDVDRIEVIRGPGATLWGANAVNGVINIITKSAKDTQGIVAAAAEGTQEQPLFAARYGGQTGGDLSYRLYAKYFDRNGFSDPTSRIDTGAWHTVRGGFRTDWTPASADVGTIQGDAYSGKAGESVGLASLTPPGVTNVIAVEQNSGANLLGRWTRNLYADSALTLQGYIDHVIQGNGRAVERRNTYDISAQHRFNVGSVNDIVWGAGYRLASIDISESFDLTSNPSHQNVGLVNFFLQDEITVVPKRLHVTLGAKFENDNLNGGKNVEPDFRAALTPTDRQTVWAAVSRAVRTPALFELDGRLNVAAFQTGPGSPPVLVSVLPNSQLDSEKLLAYELGYRFAPTTTISVDIASFLNRYSDLIYIQPESPQLELTPAPIHLLIPSQEKNASSAQSHGVEVSAQWQALQNWLLTASYTWLRVDVPQDPLSGLQSPEHQFQIRSHLDLPFRLELNAALYYVDTISSQSGPLLIQIPSYVRADLGLLWKPDKRVELGVWGQNLESPHHEEFASQSVLSEVPRSILGKVTWSF